MGSFVQTYAHSCNMPWSLFVFSTEVDFGLIAVIGLILDLEACIFEKENKNPSICRDY